MVFEPLSETASVVYEKHENGYSAELDRDEDGVTMKISPAPGANQQAENARLYIRTGVEPKPNVSYRVSFTLTGEQDQAEYAVWFDGSEKEGAFGSLSGRSIRAGGTDRVSATIHADAANGELVLRLLLGKTAGNTLRFSNLSVEEASGSDAGESVVLVDHLDYNAPGSITVWTNDDSKAVLTNGEDSATVTVTQAPTKGAEVWKIKLLAATGLKPEAGKIYRFSADVDATAARDYEVCYNEGDTEKGYAVLYNQHFRVGTQRFERLIYIPMNKQNAGELVFQLSLGKLQSGDAVTIRNIRVEETVSSFRDMLPSDFAFDAEGDVREVYYAETGITSVNGQVPTSINWSGSSIVTKIGEKAGDLVIDNENGSAEFEITGGTETYHAMMHIDTGVNLSAGTSYRTSFQIRADIDYSDYEVKYGTAVPNGWDNNETYGALKGRSLTADTTDTVEYSFTPAESGALVISLQVGKTADQRAKVTVSGLTIERLTESGVDDDDSATVHYPDGSAVLQEPVEQDNGSFSIGSDGEYSGSLSGGENSATLTCTGGSTDVWKRKLFADNICTLSSGSAYEVSFAICASEPTEYEVCYNKDGNFGDGMEKGFGAQYGLTAETEWNTVVYTIAPPEDGKLNLQFNLGKASEDARITVRNIAVYPLTTGEAEAVWPDDDSITASGDCAGELSKDSAAQSASLTVNGGTNLWDARFNLDTGADLEAETIYRASFRITAENAYENYEILYGTALDGVDNNKAYGGKYGQTLDAGVEETAEFQFKASGGLLISLLVGAAGGGDNQVTVSGLTIARVDQRDGGSIADARYPTDAEPAPAPTEEDSFSVGSTEEYSGSISGDGSSVTLTCTGGSTDDVWKRKLFVDGVCGIAANDGCQVSFDICASVPTDYEVCYNRDENFGDGKEKGFGAQYGLRAETEWQTITYTVSAAEADSILNLQFNLGKAAEGTTVSIRNIQAHRIGFGTELEASIDTLGSVWAETPDNLYEAALTRNADSVVFDVTSAPAADIADQWKDYNANQGLI